jgi:hypothetical protein
LISDNAGREELDGDPTRLEDPLQWLGQGADIEGWPRVQI